MNSKAVLNPRLQTTALKSKGNKIEMSESPIVDSLDDSSDTYSNTSYVSAIGSQEDFTLIDLHMQVNRPIIDSPMLMSSYVSHLNQVSFFTNVLKSRIFKVKTK